MFSAFATRNEDLTVMEKLEMGPVDFTAPHYDPTWHTIEPNTGTRLRSRQTSHEVLQDLLAGRYIITPELVYSVARPVNGSNQWDVPVAGDFVVLGVIAEKSDVRMTTSSESSSSTKPKRYISFKLLNMRSPAKGDAIVNVSLFESEQSDERLDEEGNKTRVYKGGSGGAYERWWKSANGSLIAILNPRITQVPSTTIRSGLLSITPQGADSIVLIGTAKDLGHCQSIKADGEACGSWCDLRVSTTCDYHVNRAVKTARSNRSEFFSGNSSTDTFRTKGQLRTTKGHAPSVRPASMIQKGSSKQGQGKTYISGVAVYAVAGQAKPIKSFLGVRGVKSIQSDSPVSNGKKSAQIQQAELDALLRSQLQNKRDETVGAQYLRSQRKTEADESDKFAETKDPDIVDNRRHHAFPKETLKILGFNPIAPKNRMKDKDLVHSSRMRSLQSRDDDEDEDLVVV
ncbi:zf-primase-domain-containing protein [Atractiella rhizophila]|nr:zf-primase-domain-containing protein [Atractiella rhizophila]